MREESGVKWKLDVLAYGIGTNVVYEECGKMGGVNTVRKPVGVPCGLDSFSLCGHGSLANASGGGAGMKRECTYE